MPVKKRVQNNMKAFNARPERNTKKPNSRLDTPTIGTRRTRSASHPMGTAPSTKNAADAVLMKTIVPSLMPNVRWISGASTLIAAPSSSSNELRSVSTTNMNAPPTAKPCAQRHRWGVDAREEIVREDDLFARLRPRRLARLLLVDDRGRECRRSDFVGHPDPPVVARRSVPAT